jgi:hypothetical protein
LRSQNFVLSAATPRLFQIFTELAMHGVSPKGMHVGMLLASWHQKVSIAVHVAHVDNVLRGLSIRRRRRRRRRGR